MISALGATAEVLLQAPNLLAAPTPRTWGAAPNRITALSQVHCLSGKKADGSRAPGADVGGGNIAMTVLGGARGGHRDNANSNNSDRRIITATTASVERLPYASHRAGCFAHTSHLILPTAPRGNCACYSQVTDGETEVQARRFHSFKVLQN